MSKKGIVSLVCIVCSVLNVRPAQTDGDISITFRFKDFTGQIVRVFLPGEFNDWNFDFDGELGPSLMGYDESESFWMITGTITCR